MTVEVDFLDGNGWVDLTPRERALMDKAREAGYAEGERHGYRVGGEDALRAATTLTTVLQQRHVRQALEVLTEFLQRQEHEDEVGSSLWRSRP